MFKARPYIQGKTVFISVSLLMMKLYFCSNSKNAKKYLFNEKIIKIGKA